jgi:molybdopterin converting factor small subunit
MRVKVLYFGVLKDYFGEGADVGLPEGATVAELLAQHEDRAQIAWKSIAVALNRDYSKLTDVLHEGDEVALLPPVSGGCYAHGESLAPLAKTSSKSLSGVGKNAD